MELAVRESSLSATVFSPAVDCSLSVLSGSPTEK
jgi:hypothetical protein